MDKIIKQLFSDHLEVAQAVMDSSILKQIETIATVIKKRCSRATSCSSAVTVAVLRTASILQLNLWVASKRSAVVCLLSR